MKTLSKAIALASLVSASALTAQVANAEVSASANIASAYLWRGQDLGEGNAAMSGSLDYSNESGLYAGIWASSGDVTGSETDLYVGFSGEAGDITYDVSYWTYLYEGEDDIDELAEVILGVSAGSYSASVYIPTDSDSDYRYITLGAEMGDYSFGLGATIDNVDADDASIDADYTHLDVTYAYNDKLAFTYSQIVDEATEDYTDMGGTFVVSYSLPIE
ncbi:MAG: hypothetical protein ACI843_000436 [Psychrobacter glaciei]|jgi:uncharacterized protein (TIGR02001 family)